MIELRDAIMAILISAAIWCAWELDDLKQEAVRLGFAEYVTMPNGGKRWAWKEARR